MIIFTVLAGKHNVAAVNFARKKSHALVFYCFAVEGYNFKSGKIFCFYQLRQDSKAVISRIGRIIGNFAVVIKKLHEPGVFTASAFVFRNGKDNPFGYSVIGSETHLIIGVGKPVHVLESSVLALI